MSLSLASAPAAASAGLSEVKLEFRLLGPVDVYAADRRLVVRPRQRLTVLAALAVDAGLVVPVETLIRRVWDKPPKQARHTLHAHISHLRGVLKQANAIEPDKPVQLVHQAAGYVWHIDRGRIDLHRFRGLVAQARAAGDDHAATALFARAMQLWRGDALAALDTPWVNSVRTSLRQEQVAAELDWTDVRLRLGQHAQLVDALGIAVTVNRHDERLAGQYMLALYRCGRQADALTHYERIRKRLDNRVALLSPPLRELRQKILNGDPDLRPPRPVPATPAPAVSEPVSPPRADRTLPADVDGFVGRRDELRRLLAAVDRVTTAGEVRTLAIHAVDGMAGIGKTAFAVHAAHHLAARFPDGQRLVELRAHAPGQMAVDPGAALETLLQADGVAAQHVPTGLDARAGLWRDRMADKRMLLVIDDAADPAQVIPLLPAGPGCLVLITSRRKLATLPGAILLSLDTLPPTDAAELFVHRAGPRANPDPDAVERIVQLCGHLPLAITLTTARLHTHPTWTVTDLANDLDHARDRLGELSSGDLAVAAAFNLSYRDLPSERQRLFRRLALHPGPDFDAYATAALDHTTLADARRGLEDLLEHNLLTEPHRGRYRFHDLIAAHARTHSSSDPQPERDATLDRLLTYYLHAATIAAAHQQSGFTPVPVTAPTAVPPSETPIIADAQQANDWLTTEQSNLAAATHAAAHHHPAAVGIPAALYEHLRSRGRWDLAIRLHRTALAAAERASNQPAQADILINLAHMLRLTDAYEAAVAAAEQARTLHQRFGNPYGQATALDALARAQYMTSDYRAAAVAAEQAHTLYRRVGNPYGQATALDTLARVQQVTGNYPATVAAAEQARTLHQQLGNQHGEANSLNTLAHAYALAGDYPAAATAAEHVRTLHQQHGDQHGQAVALVALAHVRYLSGDYPAAATAAEQARILHQQLGNRIGQAVALETFARVQHATGDYPAAATAAEHAHTLYQQLGATHGLANAMQVIGIVHHATNDHPAATTNLNQALALFRDVDDPDGEAETLNHIGQLDLDTTTPAKAHEHFATALHLARRIGTPIHEARALEGIGHCLLRQGHHHDAIQHLRGALVIYQRIHSPHTAHVETVLNQHNSETERPLRPGDQGSVVKTV
jgi:DNA-binding SARP family transcriptional activator/tetratricopeptide (TPR) repeat protein